MPDNKKKENKSPKQFLTLEDQLNNLSNTPKKDILNLKDQSQNVNKPGWSTANQFNDYGQSTYDEPLTEQYFRQTGEANSGFQEQRAQNQSSLAKLGSGLGNTLTQGTLDILKDSSYLLDFENYFDFKNSAEEGFHNWFGDAIQSVEDKLKLPVYRTEDSKGFSPLSAGFWGENMPSIASSVAMMFPAEAAVAGLGKLGGLVGGSKLIKGFEALSGVEGVAGKLKGVGSAVVSRQMEALMEGGQTYESTYQQARKSGKSEIEAKQIAGEAAATNYKANWTAIVQDIPQYMVLHKSYKDAASLFTAEAAKEIGKTALGEAGEEAYQYLTDKEAQRSALINGKVLKDDNTSLGERLINYSKDGDLWTSAFFGALGGAGFASVGVNNANKNQRQFNDILDAHKAILTGDKEGYYRAQDNLLNSTIVDNAGKNTLDKFKKGLEYIKSNPENIQDQDKAEITKRLDESIKQVEYAQEVHQSIMNDPSIKPEIKQTVFENTLAQKMAENKLRDINTKIKTISGTDASNLGFSADIQAYKAAKLKYEGIKNIPVLSNKAEELKNTLESVGNEIVNSELNYGGFHVKSINDLDKFITSSNDKNLKDLYTNQAKYEADLTDTKETLNLASTEEGRTELGKRVAVAKQKDLDTKAIVNSINNSSTEEELDNLLTEADNKEVTSPELIDIISRKRDEIQLKKAEEGLTAGLNPNESVIPTESVSDTKKIKSSDSKKSKFYNKSNNGIDDGSKESTERAFEFNEKITIPELQNIRSRVVTKNNNPELYNQILEEDPEAKQFEQEYKDKNGEEYQGIYTVITDLNNKPVLKDGKLIASTLETPKRIIDGAIIPDNKKQAIDNLTSLREELLTSKDPNIYLNPVSKSKGEPELLPRVNGERQSIPVEKSFGPIENIKVEVPISNSRNGFTKLLNGQIALNGKLYAYDKNNTAFDLIPRRINSEEADMIIDLTDQQLGLKDKTVEDPVKEIKKIISTAIPSGGPNEFTYGFKGKILYVGANNSFVLENLQAKPDEIHKFIKDFLLSTKNTNVNVNKKSGYELEGSFEGPTTNSENPGKSYKSYKEYLLEGEKPMFGTDLAPLDGRQYKNVYLIYETEPITDKVVVHSGDQSGSNTNDQLFENQDIKDKPQFKIDENSKAIPVEEFQEIADKLKEKTGINYRILSENEVLNRLKELGVDISVFDGKEAPAFFDGKEIVFPENHLESETALHEFGHFLIGAVQKENPELFDNLKKELQDNEVGQKIIDYVKGTYTWLVEDNEELSPEGWNEVITQALGKIADGSIKEDTSLWKSLKDMLKWLSNYLHELFNSEDNVIKPFELNENTSLIDLANMLKSNEKIEVSNPTENENVQFKINNETFTNEDVEKLLKDKFFTKENNNLVNGKLNSEKTSNRRRNLQKEFNELKQQKNEYIASIVNDSYPTDKPVTIDDIRDQNKDISTFKYWTGALLDLPNYLAHSIGFIIRTAQNEVEKKTNNIYSEINDKIKEISKKSNKSIQSIYDEIIAYDKDTDTKSLIKEDELESKSKEAQEFYKFYQSKIEELAQIVPVMQRRNKNGETENVLLDKYFIPNVPKSDLTSKLKSLNPVKERVVKSYTRNQNDRSDTVGLNYVEDLPSKEKSDDLGNNLFMFAKTVYNFDEMNKILPKVRLLQSEIENTEYVQGSDPNTTKSGKESNLYKMVDAFIRAQVKGQRKEIQGKSVVLGNKKNENNEDVQTYLDVTGTIDNLLSYNSLLRIGLTPVGASANVLFGKLSNFLEGVGGRFFTNKDLRKAERIFWKQTFDKNSVLNKELLSKYNILQELTDYENSENLKAEKLRKLSGEKISELLYAPQKYGEKWIQSSTLLAVMVHDGYMNENGELTDKFKKADNNEKQRLFDKITGINNKLHGRYSPKEAAAMQQNVLYRAATQFRKWIPAAFEARFDEKHFDPRLGVEVEGRYKTFTREVLSKLVKGDFKSAFYNLYAPLFDAKEALESGKLTESDIYNMKKTLTEAVLALATLFLYSVGTGDSDEDKRRRKQPWFKSTMLLLNRVSGDLNFFYSPSQINNIGKNAIPVTKLVDDLISVGPTLIEAFDSKKNKYKAGSFKGRYKLPKKLLDLVPGSKVLSDPYKILNKEALSEIK